MDRSNKGKRFPVEVLTDSEVDALIEACSSRAPTAIRNRALIVLLYRAGLRISEALALKPKDLDADAGSIRVLEGKGSKARTVGLDPASFAVIQRWMDERKRRCINGHALLLCTLKGKPLEAAYVRALFKRLAKKAGIEKRVHPHGLRHSHAAQLAREGLPVNVIQAQLGHSSLATTSLYLDHIAPQQLIEIMKSRKWNTRIK